MLCIVAHVFQMSRIFKNLKLETTAQCAVKRPIPHAFEIASGLFFVLPMTIISILYVLIGIQLRRSSRQMLISKSNGHHHSGSLNQPMNHPPPASTESNGSPSNGRPRTESYTSGGAMSAGGNGSIGSHHLRNGSNKHNTASRRAVIKMLGKYLF